MKTTMNREGDKLTVKVEGRLDTLTAPEFDDELKPALEGVKELLLDLEGLEYISSAGLRVLLVAQQEMDDKDGTMTLKNVSEDIMEVFDVTGFVDVLTIL